MPLLIDNQTTFVNSVDAPSLALLVPIVHRGLRERSAETKKKAAQIVGNMSSLVTEHKDMLPYLNLLLPEVKKVQNAVGFTPPKTFVVMEDFETFFVDVYICATYGLKCISFAFCILGVNT